MSNLNVTLLTGRTLRQGQGKEYGKLSKRYWESVAICEMDSVDMKNLCIKEGQNVKITTNFGSVVVKAMNSLRTPHQGVVFVPYGPWINVVVNPKTHGTGMPSFKGISATIEPAPQEQVLQLRDLLKQNFKKE